MRELRSQRMAAMTALMDKRGDAAKAFYAALNADQQKVFDAEYKMHGGYQGGGHGGMNHGKG